MQDSSGDASKPVTRVKRSGLLATLRGPILFGSTKTRVSYEDRLCL